MNTFISHNHIMWFNSIVLEKSIFQKKPYIGVISPTTYK